MKKKFYLLACFCLAHFCSNAQTWTGAQSAAWGDPENWDVEVVPNASSIVTIPSSAFYWPVLSGNVTVARLTMTAGSQLNLGGYSISAGSTEGQINITGATLTNGQLNLVGNGLKTLSGVTTNGNITINVSGAGDFREAATAANHFNGNVTFNFNGMGVCRLGYGFASSYLGNVTINRTVVGPTYIFDKGFTALNGNFAYNNLVGGDTYINNEGTLIPYIGGRVDISYLSTTGSPSFIVTHLRNNTHGSISIKKATGAQEIQSVEFNSDTLVVDSLVMRGFKSGAISYCRITGNIAIAHENRDLWDGEITISENIINGDSWISSQGVYTSVTEWANVFNGDTEFNAYSDLLGICYFAPSAFHGNLTVKRHRAGLDYIFVYGLTALDGDFNYYNESDFGGVYINEDGRNMATIGGAVNIRYLGGNSPIDPFIMRSVRNTRGGKISVINPGLLQIMELDVVVDSLVVRGYGFGGSSPSWDQNYFAQNTISGHVILESQPSTYYVLQIIQNYITGNTVFTVASPVASVSFDGASRYYGNVEYNFVSPVAGQTLYSARYIDRLYSTGYYGNLTVNKNMLGDLYLFETGFYAFNGNFSYSDIAGGATYINRNSYPTPFIGGQVSITARDGDFNMRRIKNLSPGGTVSVQNGKCVTLLFDTLFANISLTGINSTTTESGMINNQITGNLTVSDGASNTKPLYLYGNIVTGNSNIKSNSAIDFSVGYFNKEIYNGNVLIERAGTGDISFIGPIHFNGNVVLNSATGLSFEDTMYFGGSTNSSIEQLGTQSIVMDKIAMRKAGGAQMEFLDTLRVTNAARFESGHINATGKPLVFGDNAVHQGASAASHVIGKVIKIGNDAFAFPVGGPTTFNPVSISAPPLATDAFSARYFQRNPTLDGYNTALFQALAPNPIKKVSKCEYWNLERVNGSSNVNLTLSFGDLYCPNYPGLYITNPANARIVHWNGSLWQDLGNGGHSGTYAGTVSTAAAVSSFSPFTLASTDLLSNPLPLTLLSFDATKKDAGAEISWDTENEVNVSHYEVQRRTESSQFETIARVTALNSTARHRYKSFDAAPEKGMNYYRLKSIDRDGQFSYSKTESLFFERNAGLQLWPNPVAAGGNLNLFLPGRSGMANFLLLNSQGQAVRQWRQITTNNSVNVLKLEGLSAGVYVLQVSVEAGETQSLRLVIK